ncbi:hypothetical protein BJ085DRAFT_35908 [Dimargaris cristalligena]|uniref:Cap-specific mRNA (nucleoside-2'-O-)-methyltransferase 1 n=1 Tax=Dimargaris cristalligena TaxID=215637 RepID=A0A4P9ZQ42_9FUNG|nr:hypothetical protein BJ085DRAFT_35908 [Dimargaris cristalligena]|eukprot:RKP35493.1 hypothetical protein BJ085DRAFT_35908 [Dimargaris cristalligena]
MATELYALDDEEYQNTPLVSPIPPPSLFTVPPRTQRPWQDRAGPQPMANAPSGPPIPVGPSVEDIMGPPIGTGLRSHVPNPILLQQRPRWAQLIWTGSDSDIPPFATDSYCDPDLRDCVAAAEAKLKTLDPARVRQGQQLENPCGAVGRTVFVGREAVELAAVDSLVGLITHGHIPGDSQFFFLDLYDADAGAFADYVLWRKYPSRIRTYGWGMGPRTLNPAVPERFYTRNTASTNYSAMRSQDDDMRLSDVSTLHQKVTDKTRGQGVHLVLGSLADRSLADPNAYNTALLYQLAIMFRMLRKGGHVIFKINQLDSPLAISALFILYRYFEEIHLIKPPPGAPYGPFRYLVCRNLRVPKASIHDLFEEALGQIHEQGASNSHSDTGALLLVMPEELKADETFTSFVESANNNHTMAQFKSLQRVTKFVTQNEPIPQKYEIPAVIAKCLDIWRLPVPRIDDEATMAKLAVLRSEATLAKGEVVF